MWLYVCVRNDLAISRSSSCCDNNWHLCQHHCRIALVVTAYFSAPALFGWFLPVSEPLRRQLLKLKSYIPEEIINTVIIITSILAVWSLPVPLGKQLGVEQVQGF